MRPPQLTEEQRTRIFDNVADAVTKYYYDADFNGTNWPDRAGQRRESIVQLAEPEEFEHAVHELVRTLGTSHTGFFHQSVRRVPSRLAIAATFHRAESDSGLRWIAQDVHEGGPAHLAGLRPYDVLVSIDDAPIESAVQLTFPMGTTAGFVVERDSREISFRIEIPEPRSRTQPHSQMRSVTCSKLASNVGYMKVPVLPGMLGLDVAREIDSSMAELADCDGFILDLRGHIGGGLGVLRLMSHLTPDKLPIGYTVTRKRAESGYRKELLPKLDRLPTHLPNPLAIAAMALKFARRDPSVALLSEGLGPKRWHGRMTVLVNEHTISAGEMLAAFVTENRLATLAGQTTAGRLIPGSGIKVGHGYMLVIPKAQYITWGNRRFESVGVPCTLELPWDRFLTTGAEDPQLRAAQELVAIS